MKRILFIVIWVFVFAFLTGIIILISAIALDIAGLESWGHFVMEQLFKPLFCSAPIVGLILGLLGHLPGTKEQRKFQTSIDKESHWASTRVQFLIFRVALFFFFALVTFPVSATVIWVVSNYDAHHESILIIPVLAYYFGLLWFSNQTAKHMIFDNQKLVGATKSAFVDLKLRLAFLPLIGSWFAPDDKGDDKN